ncbi:hypothetical protein [Aeromicrobium sp. 179-A 4D2 NHS]|uniref:hypothetical protein n=1 Tax=Aeromicrobium sp. 179-A 4D2 NHS TaxID=3142375 RepID=UPI0039A11EF1
MTRVSEVPTLAEVADVDQARRARRWRRVGVTLLTLVVAAACLGLLGPREGTATDGDRLTVAYPQVTRSGSDSALTIEAKGVSADAPLSVEIPHEAFERLGLETMTPAPTAESSDGDTVRLTFEAPGADELSVDLSGRLGTRSTLGTFTFDVRVTSAGEELTASARTWVLP